MTNLSEKVRALTEENKVLKKRIQELEEPESISDREALRKIADHFEKGEERYRNILDNMEEAYYEVDLNGNLTFFNTTAVKNLGYTDDVMMGMNFCEYVDKENQHKLVEAYSRVFRTGEPVKDLDWVLISKSSGTIPVESSISLMRDAQGKSVGFRGIIRDITRRKQAEKELRESKDRLQREEERYRNILDNMEEAYYEVDLNGNLTFFNTTAVTNLGYTDSEMMGMNFRTYVDGRNARRVFDAYTRVFQTGEPVKGIDWELISKGGDTIPIESSISLMRDGNGRPVGFRGIIRDITARKLAERNLRKSEEKYRLLAENATDIIVTMDSNLHMSYVSPSVIRFRGYTDEEAMKQSPAEMLTPASFDKAMRIFAEEMEIESNGSGDPDRVRSIELELTCKNGSTIWTEVAFTFLRNNEKKFLGYLGIVHDISERKRAEEALLESEMKFRNLTETALDTIITIDMNGIITYANPAARALYAGKDIVGLLLKDILPPGFAAQQKLIFESVRQGFSEPLSYETKIRLPEFDHPRYFDIKTSTLFNHGEPSGVLFIARDATERRRIEGEIRLMAIVDTLTGLFNRRGFITLAEQQIKASGREKKKLLLFYIDLDGLKTINDTYGHEEGDLVLKKTAVILRKTFRESDIIARLGGDEFAVLVTDSEELPDVVLKRLKSRTDEENSAQDLPYRLSMSIGIADYNPLAPCSIDDLMSRADRIMYDRKKVKKQAL
ncbi:MAG TPA: PAS domain S-box protein [Spirochaetota bacterium]|nr:PAS domain S-box protein [Spirochaetota bacterium]